MSRVLFATALALASALAIGCPSPKLPEGPPPEYEPPPPPSWWDGGDPTAPPPAEITPAPAPAPLPPPADDAPDASVDAG